jgi:hypothetical protein
VPGYINYEDEEDEDEGRWDSKEIRSFLDVLRWKDAEEHDGSPPSLSNKNTELITSLGYKPGDISELNINNLFDSSSVWDKVAVNNHYADDFNLPLETLLKLVNRSEKYQSQSQLANLMDMEAWGRFSAYESLTQSKHADISHNWRLYYDSWRGKFMPVVWDTMGWYEPMRGAQILPEIITNRLTEVLYKNGDFIRSRSRALKEFFDSGSDILFMRMVSESIKTMESEVLSDPLLYPANSSFVQHRMRQLQKVIGNVLEYNKLLLRKSHVSDDLVAFYRYADNVLELSVRGKHPLETLKIEFFEDLGSDLQIQAEFKDTSSEYLVDLTEFADAYENFLHLNPGFLSNLTLLFFFVVFFFAVFFFFLVVLFLVFFLPFLASRSRFSRMRLAAWEEEIFSGSWSRARVALVSPSVA